MAFYTDGRVAIYDETTTTAAQLLAAGVWNTLSFGPGLVKDGAIVSGIDSVEVDTNFGNHSVQGNSLGPPSGWWPPTTSCSSSSTDAAPATAAGSR